MLRISVFQGCARLSSPRSVIRSRSDRHGYRTRFAAGYRVYMEADVFGDGVSHANVERCTSIDLVNSQFVCTDAEEL